MKKSIYCVFTTLMISAACVAQVGGGSAAYGNRNYDQNSRGRSEAAELNKRNISDNDIPPNGSSTFLDASVLLNVPADEYVAIFSVNQEGTTIAEANAAIDTMIKAFKDRLKSLGVGASDVYVDFIAQNRIYGYDINQNIAKEKLVGFEVKKNVSVHYRSKASLDKFIEAAAAEKIFDLVKVDYIVTDVAKMRARLFAEASAVIKEKAARYGKDLGVSIGQPVQVYAEKYDAYYPTDMYDSYKAYETEDVSADFDQRQYIIQGARKNQTFYYNGLTAKQFDRDINPALTEPPVQFTIYLKVRYDRNPAAPVASKKKVKGRS